MIRRRKIATWREDGWAFEPTRHRLLRIARRILPGLIFALAFAIVVLLVGLGLGALVLDMLSRGDA